MHLHSTKSLSIGADQLALYQLGENQLVNQTNANAPPLDQVQYISQFPKYTIIVQEALTKHTARRYTENYSTASRDNPILGPF